MNIFSKEMPLSSFKMKEILVPHASSLDKNIEQPETMVKLLQSQKGSIQGLHDRDSIVRAPLA